VFDVVQATILQPFKKERLDIVGLYNLFLFPIGSEDFLHQIFGNLLIYKTTSERHQFRIETFKESFKSSMISFPDFFNVNFRFHHIVFFLFVVKKRGAIVSSG